MMVAERTVRRILVALDASPASLAALEAAAHLAADTGAELLGLYVEDESLLRGAELPLSRVVGSFSGTVFPIGRSGIEHQLKAQAERARRAMEAVALRARLRWSFRVMRGAVTASLGAASSGADIISLGRSGWARMGLRRMGRTTASILESAGAPVLLFDYGLRPGQAVVIVYDDQPGATAALDFAGMLARDEATPLFIVLRGPEDRLDAIGAAAERDLRQLGITRQVQFYRLGTRDPAMLTRVHPAGGIGVLVLPRAGALGRGVADLLSELRCPVLIIRKAPAEAAD